MIRLLYYTLWVVITAEVLKCEGARSDQATKSRRHKMLGWMPLERMVRWCSLSDLRPLLEIGISLGLCTAMVIKWSLKVLVSWSGQGVDRVFQDFKMERL